MKKLLSFILVISLVVALIIPVLPSFAAPVGQDYLSAYWPGFRGAEDFKGLTDAKTPTNAGELELKWNIATGASMTTTNGFPIEVGEYIYYAVRNTIVRLDKETGTTIATSSAAVGNTGFFSTIVYGDGKIFMPITGGRVQAFDAETLESLWVSQVCPLSGMQSNSPITYHEGYIYMGVTNANASSGMLFCLSTADDDPSKTDEVKNYTWSYSPGYGFYWSEGVVIGNNIIFAGEGGVLVSHHLTERIVTDTFTLTKNNGSNTEAVRSSAHYDRDTGRIYVSTKAGSIHSIKINADGTFNGSSYLSKFITNDITSSPCTYKGRLYLGGGGVSSSAGFSVLNAETLDMIYQIPGIVSQSSPIVSTAYATAENNWKVYIYLLQFTGTASNNDRIFCIEDDHTRTTGSYIELAKSPNPQYNYSSLAVGKDGTLYYKNDSNRLFAFKNVNGAYSADDVINAINRLPSLSKLNTSDEALLRLTEERYTALSSNEKEAVTNAAALTAVRARMTEISDSAVIIPQLIADIDALPPLNTLTIADNDTVQLLLATYSALPTLDQPLVTNIDVLMAAKTKIEELIDIQKITDVEARINALPTVVTMSAKAAIENALSAYNELPSGLQNAVSNVAVLQSLAGQLEVLEIEITAINDAIWALDPKNITLADKTMVEDIIKRYNALNEEDRIYVEYFHEVLEFKAIIDALESNETPDNTIPKDNNKDTSNSQTNNNGNDTSNTQTSNNDKDTVAPQTGDTTNITLWLCLGSVSLAILILELRRKQKRAA